ncbi:hypothetical protein B0H14DRAFT_3883370 [Mycena olivaceomarginata]|nr:hypothetical protein B0H14DRAFT_3883370 [Mycena olivaceomarginata]
MTPIPMPMSESPWLFQGPTERLCRSLAADMKGVATNWVQGIDLDLTLMRSKVTSTLRTFFEKHSPREDCLGGSLVLIASFQVSYRRASILCPYMNPAWQSPSLSREQNKRPSTTTPHRPWNPWSSGRIDALLPTAEYVIHILAIISEVEVPAMPLSVSANLTSEEMTSTLRLLSVVVLFLLALPAIRYYNHTGLWDVLLVPHWLRMHGHENY